MVHKKKFVNVYWEVLLLQFLVIILLITRLSNLIVPDENLFFMQEFSDISLLTLFIAGFFLIINKTSIGRTTILHMLVLTVTGLHLKFFLLEESLIKWFVVALILFSCLVFLIQNFLSKKSFYVFLLFSIINSLVILWLFIDVETFTIAKTHFSFKYIFEFVRIKQLFAEAAFNIGKSSMNLLLGLVYLLILPFVAFVFKKRQRVPRGDRSLMYCVVVGILLVAHYYGFNYCCSRVSLSDYLPIRLNLGILPIPAHPDLINNTKLRTTLETDYFINPQSAYAEPKIVKGNNFNGLNIVFIAIESLRFDAYQKYMPELQRISRNGFHMNDNYSLSNITLSSLYSMFHSNYPINLAFTSKPEIKSNFERFLEKTDYTTYFIGTVPVASFHSQNSIILRPDKKFEGTPMILAKTLSTLKANKRCCILSYVFSTHFNYYYPPLFEKKLPVASENENPLFLRPTQENITKVRNRYYNAVSYVDSCLSSFFSEVYRLGLDKKTIFVIFGDHGESLGEAGFFAHATGPHKSQFHVPLIIVGGPISPTVINWPTSHIDILPTISKYLDFNISNHHGISTLKPRDYPIVNLDEAVSGRIIIRRKKTMSLFDIDSNYRLKWLATLNNNYTLTSDILKLYEPSGLSILADRIDKDAKFIVNKINQRAP